MIVHFKKQINTNIFIIFPFQKLISLYIAAKPNFGSRTNMKVEPKGENWFDMS